MKQPAPPIKKHWTTYKTLDQIYPTQNAQLYKILFVRSKTRNKSQRTGVELSTITKRFNMGGKKNKHR